MSRRDRILMLLGAALVTVAALAVVGALGAGVADADFTPLVLVSGSSTQESDYALEPVVSAGGRYVVFTGSQSGVAGIYRKDLSTGALDLVSPGATAGAPSVSADGTYVSFTTSAADPATGQGSQCSAVYRADLHDPAHPIYALVSAVNGGTASLTYAGASQSGCPGGGSSAADRVAISADGTKVAFTVVGESNLVNPTQVTTPGAQVAVRDLSAQTTTLVSATASSSPAAPQPVAGGAAILDTSTGTGSNAGTANADAGDSSAAISADGSTVAWLGINIPSQAAASSQDAPVAHPYEYDEPLWRRIADGAAAVTRRVSGGDDPACGGGCGGPLNFQWSGNGDNNPSTDAGPDRGSFIAFAGFTGATPPVTVSTLDAATPQLSADGHLVAMLSTQPPAGSVPACGQGQSCNAISDNAYIVDMTAGLTRAQALTRLTDWASDNFGNASLAGMIESIAISPEGDRIAFVTRRTAFPYSPPALITPQLSAAANDQLYVANLTDGTLELVTTGFDSQPANGTVSSPSFSAAGGPLAFSSAATNLVYGAASDTTGGQEVFTTSEVAPPRTPGAESIGAPAPSPWIVPQWQIQVAVASRSRGRVVLSVAVPGAGELSAVARAAVPTAPLRRRGRHRGRARARGRRAPRVLTRTIARGRARVGAPGVVLMTLSLRRHGLRLPSRGGSLYAAVRVTFAAAGEPMLSARLPVDWPLSRRKRR